MWYLSKFTSLLNGVDENITLHVLFTGGNSAFLVSDVAVNSVSYFPSPTLT